MLPAAFIVELVYLLVLRLLLVILEVIPCNEGVVVDPLLRSNDAWRMLVDGKRRRPFDNCNVHAVKMVDTTTTVEAMVVERSSIILFAVESNFLICSTNLYVCINERIDDVGK